MEHDFFWKASWVGSKRVKSKPRCVELNRQSLMKELRLLGSMKLIETVYFISFPLLVYIFLVQQNKHTTTQNPNKPPFQGFTEAHRKEGIPIDLVSSYRKTCNKTKHPLGIGAELSQGRGQKQHLFEIRTSDDRLLSCACGIHRDPSSAGAQSRYLASEISLMSIPQKCFFPCFNMFRWLWTY